MSEGYWTPRGDDDLAYERHLEGGVMDTITGSVENTMDELDTLKGATITDIRIEADGYGDFKIVMEVDLRSNLRVNGEQKATFEVWQDEEGNGPGYLALVAGAHDCEANAVPYTNSGGPLGHGWECGVCGKFLQAG